MAGNAQAERQALADLLVEVGPDAPTLCEGWTTRDLAAHLVLRERRPAAAAGIMVGRLAPYTARVQQALRDGRPWPALVQAVRDGPPAYLRLLDEPVNTIEYFVHHEDVRRARPGWSPRALPPALERALWARLRMLARVVGRRAPVGLVLDAPGYGRATARRGEPEVTVTGPPGELVLFATGRQRVAQVELSGPPEAVERVRGADFGL